MMPKQHGGVRRHAVHPVVVRMARRRPAVVDVQPPFEKPAVREKGDRKQKDAGQKDCCEHGSLDLLAVE